MTAVLVLVLVLVLVRDCELRKPRKSGMFVKPSLRADDRGEGGEPVGAGSWRVLAVEFAEPFLLAEPVELGGDDRGGGWSAGLVNWA